MAAGTCVTYVTMTTPVWRYKHSCKHLQNKKNKLFDVDTLIYSYDHIWSKLLSLSVSLSLSLSLLLCPIATCVIIPVWKFCGYKLRERNQEDVWDVKYSVFRCGWVLGVWVSLLPEWGGLWAVGSWKDVKDSVWKDNVFIVKHDSAPTRTRTPPHPPNSQPSCTLSPRDTAFLYASLTRSILKRISIPHRTAPSSSEDRIDMWVHTQSSRILHWYNNHRPNITYRTYVHRQGICTQIPTRRNDNWPSVTPSHTSVPRHNIRLSQQERRE
jgi:hypothetical protein